MRQAARAASPLRSVPLEAAVGEVLGTLPVEVGVMCTRSSGDLQLVGDDLRHLGDQALAHLGAAVVQMHAAVGVEVHQRAGLVHRDGGEGRCRT